MRQYLLFEAQAELGADVAVGYERASRVATLWMRPAEGVRATITPRGVVSAEATGFFSSILGGVAAATGNSVSERARQQAGELGSTMLRDRLAVGFTMTLSLDRNQVDFMVGSLQRGEVPERPYPPTTHAPWVVNQRSTVWPGGLDVVGPVDPRNGRLGIDLALEEGDGATVRATCADALTQYFDARFRTPDVAPPAPPRGSSSPSSPPAPRPSTSRSPTPSPAAPARSSSPSPRAAAASPRACATGSPPRRPAPPRAPAARRVRIQVVGATVSHDNASGRAWDLVGGEADLTAVTASIPLGRAIDTAPVIADHDNATWSRWLPGNYDLARDLPLRISVFDDDATTRELIGVADLDAARVPAATGDFTLPLRSEGAVPRQTGTLRLRVEVLPVAALGSRRGVWPRSAAPPRPGARADRAPRPLSACASTPSCRVHRLRQPSGNTPDAVHAPRGGGHRRRRAGAARHRPGEFSSPGRLTPPRRTNPTRGSPAPPR